MSLLKKRFFCFFLCVLLGMFPVLPALADTFVTHENTVSDCDGFSVDCSGKTVKVTALSAKQSGYLLVRLTNTDGAVCAQKAASRKNGVSLSTVALKDGNYYVELFTGKTITGEYESYASGKSTLLIAVKSGIPSRVISESWAQNLKLFSQNRTDALALSYYKTASAEIQSGNKTLSALAKVLTADKESTLLKIQAIHDWVTSTLYYDYDNVRTANDAVTAFQTQICGEEGYANLTAALLRAADIPAKVVYGYAENDTNKALTGLDKKKENHCWNEAYDAEENRWVILDTCWDGGNTFRSGKKITGESFSRYFDPTLEAFSFDHLLMRQEDTDGLAAYFKTEVKKVQVKLNRAYAFTEAIYHTAKVKVTLPDSLADAKLTYASSDKAVASVTKAGTVTGNAVGTVALKVKVSDGVSSYTFKKAFKVYHPFLKYTASVSKLKVGKSYSFAVKQYGVSGTVKWSVSNTKYAAINSKGKLTAKKSGTVTVTATVDGVKKSVKVKITK